MRSVNILLGCGFAVLLGTTLGHAQTIVYNNGDYTNANDCYNMTDFAVADDFVVTSSLSFDQIRFWAGDQEPGTLPAFSGTLSYFVYNNNIDRPGTVLASGEVSAPNLTITDTGVIQFGEPFDEIAQVDFSIPTVNLGPGTYWFRVKEGGLTESTDGSTIRWVSHPHTIGNTFRQDSDEAHPTTWSVSGRDDLAFQLRQSNNTPEPCSLALVGLVAIPLAWRKRHRLI